MPQTTRPAGKASHWQVTATYNNSQGQPVLTYTVALPRLLDALQAVHSGLALLGVTARGFKVSRLPVRKTC